MNAEQFATWLARKNTRLSAESILTPPSQTVFEQPLVMGILNVTTDSFFDGGAFLTVEHACAHASKLIASGADIIDIGGESSHPGAVPTPLDIELQRVIPVIRHIRQQSDVCISIDTYKPEVMTAAVEAGANIINDIYALRQDGSIKVAATLDVPVCLMHMQGHPRTMQEQPHYSQGVMNDLLQFFAQRLESCEQAGIDRKKILIDPGFGFGKKAVDNLQLTNRIQELLCFNLPLLLGVSRKHTIGVVLGKPVHERLMGSIALTVYLAMHGVSIIRTHDVEETIQALQMIRAVHHMDVGN